MPDHAAAEGNMGYRMKKHLLLRTNLIICTLLLSGFVIVSLIGYHSNTGAMKKSLEHVSTLTAESIYYQINSFFSRPLNVSLTMSNDSLLKLLLTREGDHLGDRKYLAQLQNYLHAYQKQYGYDSVFLISTRTHRYYHFNGLDRVLTPDNRENTWYYNFLKDKADYYLNVDNDEAAGDEITVFVNCKIKDSDGAIMGVVGVGMRVRNLQELLRSYDRQYGLNAMLVDEEGTIQISSEETGDNRASLFDSPHYAASRGSVLGEKNKQQIFWTRDGSNEIFVAARYIPELKWHLLVEKDAGQIHRRFVRQFLLGFVVTLLITGLILYIINWLIIRYNKKILELTVSQELEYQNLLREATEGLYENVFELNITKDCANGDNTRRYFESLGMDGDVSYSAALKVIAQKQIKEEFAQGYLAAFTLENVINAYQSGRSELFYDFMITDGGESWRWMRIRAKIFYWDSDKSVRMIAYRQDITAEKEREAGMLKMAQNDPLTGILNKSATNAHICKILEETDPAAAHALLMIDVDHFKQINDSYGHAVGDGVLREIAAKLRFHFREDDVCGRIGGDEFMVFLKDISGEEWLNDKLERLVTYLHNDITIDGRAYKISSSIGAVLYPEAGSDFDSLYRNADAALYLSKEHGRDRFTIYHPPREE